MKYKAVIFDLYGTLVGNFSMPEHEAVVRKMALTVGAPPDDFARMWFDSYDWRAVGKIETPEDNIRYVCLKLGIRPNEDKVREAAGMRYEFTRLGLKPRPEAVSVIKRLRVLGLKVGVVSDCSAETPLSWNSTPLAALTDATIFSCDVGMKKPDPGIFLLATQELGVRPQECIYVGDGASQELTGAANAGMYPVMIRSPLEAPDTHRTHEENWEGTKISSLREVLGLVSEDGRLG